MAFQLFTWAVTCLSIFGVILNIHRSRWCFVVWLGTNTAWLVVDLAYGIWAQAALMGVYVLLAVYGMWKWGAPVKA